tara:strand:+ start:14989 stop:16767 length:1779 start_codon:yes stop_codon:yes gene_type:complete
MNERDKLIAQLIKEKGGTREQYLYLLNNIAHHESAGTYDPSIKQIGGGPGRGVYQFEEGSNQGGITAAKRTKQYYEQLGEKVPTWLSDATKEDSLDASSLDRSQQDALFLGNMRQHPKADFSKVWNGDESVADFWANYHWAGNPRDRKARLESFNNSSKSFDNERIPMDGSYTGTYPSTPPPPQVDASLEGRPTDNSMNNFMDFSRQRLAMGGQAGPKGHVDNEVNMFSGGGTHEQNPLGGIPQGTGDNGQQNTVEEDEASYNFKEGKFIFSNRIEYDNPKSMQSISNQYGDGGNVDSQCGGPGQPPCPDTSDKKYTKQMEFVKKAEERDVKENGPYLPAYLKPYSDGYKLVPRELPETKKIEGHRDWMSNWLGNRPEQFKNVGKIGMEQEERTKAFNWINGNKEEREEEYIKDLTDKTQKRVKSVKYLAAPKEVPGNTYITAASGVYTPYGHTIHFPTNLEDPQHADKETIAHETAHATGLGKNRGTAKILKDVLKNDEVFNKTLENSNRYYKSNSEIHSRIFGLRRSLDLKPNEVVTPELIKQKADEKYKKGWGPVDYQKLKKIMTEKSLIKLMNMLVDNSDTKNNNYNV